MINRKLNKNEINLIKMLIILLFLVISNKFIIEPVNIKISELEANKQNIINIQSIKENLNNDEEITTEDVILSMQKELGGIVNIDYIEKYLEYDENINKTNIEIKVSGTLEQIFIMQEAIDRLDLSRNMKYLEINTVQNTNNESEEKLERVECILQINVG